MSCWINYEDTPTSNFQPIRLLDPDCWYYIHTLNGKQCRSRSVGFFRSQLIWIYTVCKSRAYPGSAGQGLKCQSQLHTLHTIFFFFVVDFNSSLAEQGMPCLNKRCRSRSGSTLFIIKYVSFYKNHVIWLAGN